MTAYDFSLIKNTSVAFDATVDSINLGSVAATAVSFSASGSNLVITIGSDTVTLQNTTLAQLTTSNAFLGSSTTRAAIFVGDNSTGSVLDNSGNTINTGANTTNYTFANQQNSNHLIYGFGGGDAITANGSGDQVIFGGSGIADSTDGNDTIAMGSGSNTLYANSGNDVITFGTATLAGKTVTAYLGLGDDSFTSGAAGGSHVIYGNSGADTINQTGQTGDATLFGGNGIADSTDGNDVFTLGTGTVTAYGNSGNDSITTTAIAANKTQTVFAGVGNDTITAVGTADGTAKGVFYGNTGSDTITATLFDGDYTIFGGNSASDSTDGADSITAGIGNAVIYANAGNDVINVSGAMTANKTAIVYTGAGNDTVNSTAGTTDGLNVAFYSNAGDDVFNLNNSNGGSQWNYTLADFASGDKVNVTLQGASAAALTVSGGGSSLVVADASSSGYTFQGYSGDVNATNFVISGGSVLATNFSTTATTLTGADAKADQLVSGSAGDTLVGGNTAAGNHDKLVGNAGDDVFQFNATAAADLDGGGTVSGGEGTDTLEITGTTAANLADADFTAQITSVEKIKVANVASNTLALNTGAETAGVNYVDASALTGTNQLTVTFGAGYDTASTVVGGAGADVVTYSTATGSFAVSIDGAAGNDIFTFEDAVLDSTDTLTGGTGTDKVIITDTAGGYTLADSVFTNWATIEQVQLNNAADNISITLGAEAQAAGIVTVDGSAENAGGQTINISATAYTTAVSLVGGSAADTLTGGSGNDTIIGGAGTDTSLTGGTGSDLFMLNAAATEAASGNDVIIDFAAGSSGDSVGLDRTVVSKAAASALVAADVRLQAATGTMYSELSNSVSNDAATDRVIVLNNATVADENAAETAANAVGAGGTAITANAGVWIIWSNGTDSFVSYDSDYDTDAGGGAIESVFTLKGYTLALLNTLSLTNFDFV